MALSKSGNSALPARKTRAMPAVGVPFYVEQTNGDLTSEYILHYCYYDDLIVLVDIASHPPFELPSIDKITYAI